jgi:hypothetical protein
MISALGFPYSEHLGSTSGACTLCRRFAILHGYSLGVFHFPFGSALHTICLHQATSFLVKKHKTFIRKMSRGNRGGKPFSKWLYRA